MTRSRGFKKTAGKISGSLRRGAFLSLFPEQRPSATLRRRAAYRKILRIPSVPEMAVV